MKSFIKKTISASLVLILIFAICTPLTACYHVNSGSLSDIEGTYRLTGYLGKEDLKEARGIELSIVIRSDGTGYYAYKSNDTDAYISPIKCEFEADEENPGKYSYVTLTFSKDSTKHRLAIDAKNKNLNSQTAVWKGSLFDGNLTIDYYIDVDFTKISKDTDLTSLKKDFGDIPFYPFGSLDFGGIYKLGYLKSGGTGSDNFVYYYVRFDPQKSLGEAWYMLKEDEEAVHRNFKLSVVEDGSKFYYKFDGTRVDPSTAEYDDYITHRYRDGSLVLDYFGYLSDEELEAEIANDISQYLESKSQPE